MKGRILVILVCVAGGFLVVGASTTGESNDAKTESTVVAGQPDAQHLANGPKGIPPGWEKIVFVHYRKPPAKPDGKPPKSDSQCYGFLGRGVKWNIPGDSAFLIDAGNSEGLTPHAVLTAIRAAAATWADQTTEDILSCLLWSGSEPLEPDWGSPDGVNEVVLGDVGYSGAIAITIVWGIFGGPPGDREIMEFDMIFDDVDFDWSTSGDPEKMDLQNIATHELGHAVGLDDLYQSGCAEVTMYGYSTEGETKKCTLEPADIAGLLTLYPLR